jgi:DNA (cytosine-5)-methyltransferase 1
MALLRAIELFCASGALALGFRRAGIEFDIAIDSDANACASYEANLGRRPIRMDVRDWLRLLHYGFTGASFDLLVADPPCAPWSRAGKRKGLSDPRDLIAETVEIIRMLRPRAFLIGNVPGLDDASNEDAVRATIGGLWQQGYEVEFARLDAASYGVPQHRMRPYWFGRPRNSARLRWPVPTHGEVTRQQVLPGCEVMAWVTCRQALAHLPPKDIGRLLRQKRNKKHRPSKPARPANVVTANGSRHQTNALEWPWDRPATSVACDPRILPPGHNTNGYRARSGANAIALSERAAAILQGFPDGWVFSGKSKIVRWRQIGQAVPAPLAETLGRSIVDWFERNDVARATLEQDLHSDQVT